MRAVLLLFELRPIAEEANFFIAGLLYLSCLVTVGNLGSVQHRVREQIERGAQISRPHLDFGWERNGLLKVRVLIQSIMSNAILPSLVWGRSHRVASRFTGTVALPHALPNQRGRGNISGIRARQEVNLKPTEVSQHICAENWGGRTEDDLGFKSSNRVPAKRLPEASLEQTCEWLVKAYRTFKTMWRNIPSRL